MSRMFLIGRRAGPSSRSREEEIRGLHETLPLAATKAKDPHRALLAVVRKLCGVFAWDFGETWVPSRDGSVLKPGPAWPRTNPAYTEFRTASRRLGFHPGGGLPGRVWKDCAPVWIDDVENANDAGFTRGALAASAGFKSLVALPIQSGVDVLGVIVLYRLTATGYDEDEIEALGSVLAPLGPVLARKKVEVELAVRERQQKAVARLGLLALDEKSDLDTLMQAATRLGAVTLGVDHASLLELQPDGATFLLRAGVGWSAGLVGRQAVRDSQAGFTLAAKEAVIVQDLDREQRFQPSAMLKKHRIVSGLSVMVHGKPHPYGVLAVHGRQRRSFTPDDVHFLQALANVIAASVERDRAETELAEHRRHLETLVARRTRELEQSHERLRTAERLASIGTLAAGLGHDLGNTILPVLCRLDSLEAGNITDAAREDLSAVRQAVEYLRQLSQGLRLFALDPRQEGSVMSFTDIHTWWRSVSPLLRNALPKRITLKGEFPDTLPTVAVAPHRLSQAVLNLVANSAEAIEGDGSVYVWAETLPDGERVRLGVADDGKGMSPEVRRHSLDPFFTTKTRRLSTGLGLALVHAITQGAGGNVDIESTEGEGTTFLLTLPAADEETPAPEPERMAAAISLSDPRMAAYVELLLHSTGIEVEPRPDGDPRDTQVWITEPSDDTYAVARQYVAEDSRRRVVFFGDVPASAIRDGHSTAGFVYVNQRRGPDAVRRSLRQVVFQLLEKDDDLDENPGPVR